ncbi:hypothetical protein [Actinoplanes ianthinogenes]|nr:hypothetical protein [Actinoplanes ianthinogenes]
MNPISLPVPEAADGAAATIPWALIAAIVTAAAGALLAVWTARRKSREEERARQRTLFAEAFQAYSQYKNMPYAIRRRRHDDAAAERVRLSEILREIQSKLTFYETWIDAESATVGVAYSKLIAELRRVAGGAMREAWKSPPLTDDAGMNLPLDLVDLDALKPLEKAYTDAFQQHLEQLAPWWPHAGRRPLRTGPGWRRLPTR